MALGVLDTSHGVWPIYSPLLPLHARDVCRHHPAKKDEPLAKRNRQSRASLKARFWPHPQGLVHPLYRPTNENVDLLTDRSLH